MSQTVFISDLHLSQDTPNENAIFRRLLQQTTIDSLYILGDFFAIWIGHDVQNKVTNQILQWLAEASQRMKIYFMRGNRDFLFQAADGIIMLADPTVIDLYGTPTLLTHGDSLCTADRYYQYWRFIAHQPWLQKAFLALPQPWRQKIANYIRQRSQQHAAKLTRQQMDVDFTALKAMMAKYQVKQIIHGHTHAPLTHRFLEQNQWHHRWVLPDWQWQSQGLIASATQPLQAITFY